MLFVGRLNQQKGTEILLHAVSRIARPVHLDVIGDGDDREALEELARGSASPIACIGTVLFRSLASPTFTGRRRHSSVPWLKKGWDSSRSKPSCAKRRSSHSIPAVFPTSCSTTVPGSVPTVDAGALAAAISSLLDRPDRGAALGAAGRLHALATFAPQSVAKRYADVYMSAIASSPQ